MPVTMDLYTAVSKRSFESHLPNMAKKTWMSSCHQRLIPVEYYVGTSLSPCIIMYMIIISFHL